MAQGGKREGAGRPRKSNQTSMNIRLDQSMAEEIRAKARAEGISISSLIENVLRGFLEQK